MTLPYRGFKAIAVGNNFAACYLNAYITKGAVVTARFGDNERDDETMNILEKAFPQRKVVMLRIDHIASGGGGIRCLTQPMPEGAIK